MTDVNSFFSFKNSVEQLSDSDTAQLSNYIEAIIAFTRTTNKSIYVIDYEKKGFEYVSDNPLFLCGHSAQAVLEMGYEFYFKHVPAEDLKLLLKINTIGFDFFEQIPLQERKEYTISYDFLLKTGEGKLLLINQKLTPLFLTEKGKIWKALCIVSLSTKQGSGNITIHKNGSNQKFKYDLEGSFWSTRDKIELSDREKEILQYSIRGYSINEIAEKAYISPDTVKFHRRKLFAKLDVANISEAISYANVNSLI
ncbi:helix-turn-helix transcriptional regulator [Salegentibacter sp. JZCK2]|uniref:response regulator transcription factor n=1 Tax=Salegentibacter tibetensis TaxID=2873600 RepID=UPI001CCBF39D|nr:helix-turn-helix transcriptional regulator [Salegentibacter tibetensis]MBZ9730118.1 helix-turn-helix transcriptional regulator [Salegentibacter tibetensis]